MSSAGRFSTRRKRKRFYAYALLICIFSLGLTGCSGLVTANGVNPQTPALAISGVQAATPTASSFQVNWSTNVAANSAVDYGSTANYGSSTPTNSSMVTGHQVAVVGLSAGTLYHFRVRSTDANNSTASGPDMTFATSASLDTTPPTVSITAPANGATVSGTISVTANASDNVGVASVQFQLDGANLGNLDTTSPYSVSWNSATASNASHNLKAIAKDAAGNSTTSAIVTVTVNNAADTVAPTVPGGLSASAISSAQIKLSWTASTDNVGVTGYNIFRGGVKIATAPGTSFQDAGLTASTSYTYNVSAFDAAGNTSAQSTGASATTLAASSGGGIPSSLGWYQIPNTAGPACPTGFTGCANVVAAWSGAVADATRNRLIVWGGGHTDYNGNEIYALDLNSLAFTRLNNPSTPVNSCTTANADGTPNARHTYGGLAYLPSADQLFAFNGSLACAAGSGPNPSDSWTYTFSTSQWQRIGYTGNAPGTLGGTHFDYLTFGDGADYDPNTGLVFAKDGGGIFSYNPATKVWTPFKSFSSDYHLSSVIDPKRKLFISVGNNRGFKVDISAGGTAAVTNLVFSGCGAMLSSIYPGLAYDPIQDRIVGWAGGDTVYLYNPSTDSCTSVTYANGPGAQQANGTFGRFRYFPSLGVFAVVNGWQQNAYALRLTSGTGGSSGPTISGITVSGITTIAANISWTTDVPATTQVEYGLTTAYGILTTLNSTLATSHSQALTGLAVGTLFHYRVHSKNSAGIESISGDAIFSTNSTTDTTPPTVSLTAPAAGATVSGTVTVSANASDNVAVARVQFTVDGANVGTPLTASPYQMSWDSSTAANGSHAISAVATDTSGNTATASAVSVTVSNASGAAAALQDFKARCTAPGVVFCQGFDDASGFQQNVNIFPNATYPGIYPTQDTTVMRSGTSSIRIDIPAFQGPNMGKFDSAFTGIGGNNSDIYFQVATRISPEMLSNFNNSLYQWPTWKNHGFFNGNTSCTGQSVVNVLNTDGKIPIAGQNCLSNGFYTNGGVPPYLMQQGDYNCQYRGETPTTCFYWPTNTWVTFYYHVHLATIDANGNYPNSLIEAWVAVNGQPYKKWIDLPGYTITGNGPGALWNHLELYPYMTGKSGAIGGYPTASVWWDELIVSSQPIVAPAVPPAVP